MVVCNHNHINPVVLIASHKRISITEKNIRSLLNQSIKPKVILVLSDQKEVDHFKNTFYGQIDIVVYSNKVLGAKWQAGVDASRSYCPNPLIITGSDDILGNNFIKNALYLLQNGNHFIGLRRWFIVEPKEQKAYLFDYLAPNFPLGGGRVYSGKLLQKLDYKIFNTTANRHLDDLGWHRARSSKHILVQDIDKHGLYIVAIKGDWPVMNTLQETFTHKNARLLGEWELKDLNTIIDPDVYAP